MHLMKQFEIMSWRLSELLFKGSGLHFSLHKAAELQFLSVLQKNVKSCHADSETYVSV